MRAQHGWNTLVLTVMQLSDHRPVLAQFIMPCRHFAEPSEPTCTYEVVFQKLTMSFHSLSPTANGAPPGKPFIRVYLSCGSLQQHAPADDAKFAEIHDGYDKIDLANPDDQVFLVANSAASQQSLVGGKLAPEQEIARGSGSSIVSPHLMAESELTAAPTLVLSTHFSWILFLLKHL
jgi:hypothetical protein